MNQPFDVCARYYDVDTAGQVDDVPFLLETAHRVGGPILEVACGTGRVLIPLAEAGYEVVGVDISTEMIAVARSKVANANLESRVTLHVADARSLRLGRTFPLAIVALNSFTHFETPDDQAAVLQRLHEHLDPNGVLVLDLPNPETTLLTDAAGQVFYEYTRPFGPAGATLVKFRSQIADPATQVVAMTFIFDEVAPDGALRRAMATFNVRYLYRAEAELLLSRHGFAVEHVYGDYDLNPYTSSSEKLVIVARRV